MGLIPRCRRHTDHSRKGKRLVGNTRRALYDVSCVTRSALHFIGVAENISATDAELVQWHGTGPGPRYLGDKKVESTVWARNKRANTDYTLPLRLNCVDGIVGRGTPCKGKSSQARLLNDHRYPGTVLPPMLPPSS